MEDGDEDAEEGIAIVRVDVGSAPTAPPQAEQKRLLPARAAPQAGQFIEEMIAQVGKRARFRALVWGISP